MKINLRALLFPVLLLYVIMSRAEGFVSAGIYYAIYSDKNRTVCVSKPSSEYVYEGDITIPSYVVYKNVKYTVTEIASDAFRNSDIVSVSFPDEIYIIPDMAFWSCSKLKFVGLGNSMQKIGSWAFWECKNLVSIKGIENVSSIGEYAFALCSNLEWIAISGHNTFIGDYSFYGCSALSTVSLGENVIHLGKGAFGECGKLKELSFNAISCGFDWDTVPTYSSELPGPASDLPFPSTLTNVIFGNVVKKIPSFMFYGCKELTTINIPNSVIEIGNRSFEKCLNLKKVPLSNNLERIGDRAFYECHGLSSLSIPNRVRYIGYEAFAHCNNLESIHFGENVEIINSFAFMGCNKIKTLELGKDVKSIGSWSFAGCTGLLSVSFPKSLTSIGNDAFLGCMNLRNIYCKMPIPFNCDPSFESQVMKSAELYIPVGSKEAYKAVKPWQDFQKITEVDFSSAIDDLSAGYADVSVTASNGRIVISNMVSDVAAKVYNMQGALVAETAERVIDSLSPDLYIVSVGGKSFKVMLK